MESYLTEEMSLSVMLTGFQWYSALSGALQALSVDRLTTHFARAEETLYRWAYYSEQVHSLFLTIYLVIKKVFLYAVI